MDDHPQDERPEDVFGDVLKELQDWKWERWSGCSAREFQERLNANSAMWCERFMAARRRETGDLDTPS